MDCWTFLFHPLRLSIYFCQFVLNSARFPWISLSVYLFMFLCVYSCGPLTFFLNFINVCRNRLILQVLAAHTLHIPKKGLFQNWPLDSSWKLGSESLERSSGATQRQSDEMLRTSKCHCSEPPICSVGRSLGKLRQALHVCSITPVQTLDSRLR